MRQPVAEQQRDSLRERVKSRILPRGCRSLGEHVAWRTRRKAAIIPAELAAYAAMATARVRRRQRRPCSCA